MATPDNPQVPLYRALASALDALIACNSSIPRNTVWAVRWGEHINYLCKNHLPSGSGFDKGSSLIRGESWPHQKLVLSADFHHMDSDGSYVGWTEHKVTVKASMLHGVELSISGRDRNNIKDHIHEAFYLALTTMVDQYPAEPKGEPS